MYFPYLRGRQFELIALRELVENNLIGEDIYPVIEPVKLSSTLISTLKQFQDSNRKIAVIMNPSVGSLNFERITDTSEESCNILNGLFDSNVTKAFHLDDKLSQYGVDLSNIVLIAKSKEFAYLYNKFYPNNDFYPLYTLIPDESDFRRNIRNKNRVMLCDNFNRKEKNADYINGDEFYTNDHRFYRDDGYVGFSDYSIVGDEYSESGFAPYAVAIHIVFFAENDEMRVMHFVSDTNYDYSDTANKFHEALQKLIKWKETHCNDFLRTEALDRFEDLYRSGAYPGLGTVKKLSIMHHLELMNKFLRIRKWE